jgi:hypothetical protein
MRFVSVEVLIKALQERGLDHIYEALEKLLMEEPLAFINKDGKVVFTPFDPEELWDFLENIKEVQP